MDKKEKLADQIRDLIEIKDEAEESARAFSVQKELENNEKASDELSRLAERSNTDKKMLENILKKLEENNIEEKDIKTLLYIIKNDPIKGFLEKYS